MSLASGTALLALALLASPARALEHHYTIAVSADLATMHVTATFAGPVDRIAARSGSAAAVLVSASSCDKSIEFATRGRQLALGGRPATCLEYTVDLAAAAAADGQRQGFDGEAVVVSPARWLWRPRLGAGDRLVARFELAPGQRVAIPWQPVPGTPDTFVLTRSPESGRALAVFGRFPAETREIAGTALRVALLGPAGAEQAATLADWVRATAARVTLAYGRLPAAAVSVFLVPVSGDGRGDDSSAVPFGRVVRDGGDAIELLVNRARPIEEFYSEWTPTHEFAHLMLPYLGHEDRWISEGFATYYQNVLLARAGVYSDTEAWQRLVAGFGRGRQSVPWLSPQAAAAAGERNTRMKVYWSGAALALLADVELRRRSGGADSLDTVLGALADCCLPSDRGWTGAELFRTLDGLTDEPVFMPLYREYAGRAGFPEVDEVLAALGVTGGQDVILADTAPLAPLRAALLGRPAGPDR